MVALIASGGLVAPAVGGAGAVSAELASASAGAAAATAYTGSAGAAAGSAGAAGGISSFAVACTPIGLGLIVGGAVVLGVEPAEDLASSMTWDCWKALLHDTSPEASCGLPLHEVLSDTRIRVYGTSGSSLLVCNTWGEAFSISPVMLPNGQIAAHASPTEESAENADPELLEQRVHSDWQGAIKVLRL